MALITTAHRRHRRWGRIRGTIAVAVLLLTALEALLSAVTGWPPVTRVARSIAAPFAAAWRAAAWRTIPAVPIVTIRTASEGSRDHGRDA